VIAIDREATRCENCAANGVCETQAEIVTFALRMWNTSDKVVLAVRGCMGFRHKLGSGCPYVPGVGCGSNQTPGQNPPTEYVP
jgi:hypothetical protein